MQLVDVLLEEVDGDGALVGRVPSGELGGRAVTVVLLRLVVIRVVLAVTPANRAGKGALEWTAAKRNEIQSERSKPRFISLMGLNVPSLALDISVA